MSEIQCLSCDEMMPAGTRFCTTCGAKLLAAESVTVDEPDDAVAAGEPDDPDLAVGFSNAGFGFGSTDSGSGIRPPPRAAGNAAVAPASLAPVAGRISYDPGVIGTFADALYRMADRIIFTSTIVGVLVGGALGYGVGSTVGGGMIIALLGAGVGGYFAWSRAQARTFQLRLDAQLALCQVQIEYNTRASLP